MTVKMDDEAATIMAAYWANTLRAPKAQDNGADDVGGVASSMMADILRKSTKAPSAEEIDRFEVVLRDLLAKYRWCKVGVDYHPDRTLAQAIEESELPTSMATFPWKTTTRWHPDGSITAYEARGKVILREATVPPETEGI